MKNWTEATLGQVFRSITNGVNCDQKSNTGRHLVTRIETISKSKVNLERIGRATLSEKELQKYRLQRNDILFSHINSPIHVGKTALFDLDDCCSVLSFGSSFLIREANRISSKSDLV